MKHVIPSGDVMSTSEKSIQSVIPGSVKEQCEVLLEK
jgi:hypothetical protein